MKEDHYLIRPGQKSGLLLTHSLRIVSLCLIVLLIITLYCYRVLLNSTLTIVDNDQPIMWLAAQDFSKFIFYEPRFYGQSYNTMIEGLLAAPLLWAGIPVPTAVPIVTTILAIGSFLALSAIALRKRMYKVALLIIFFPIFLPLEYLIISFMPRGFIPGIFFASLSCFCLLSVKGKKGLFLWSTLAVFSVTVNANAMIFVLPVSLYALLIHYREMSFYVVAVSGLIAGGIYQMLSSIFYHINPVYIIHPSWPFAFSFDRLWDNLSQLDRYFKWITPLFNVGGVFLLVCFFLLILILIRQKKMKSAVAIISGFVFIMLSLGIAKVYDADDSVYFSYERFYLGVPHIIAFGLILICLEERKEYFPSKDRVIINPAPNHLFAVCHNHADRVFWIVLVFILFIFIYRQLTLTGKIETVMANKGRVMDRARVSDIIDICEKIAEISARKKVELVAFPEQDSLLNFSMAALYHCEIDTVSPYDRRLWRLVEESNITRDRFLIYDTSYDSLKISGNFQGKITVLQKEPVSIVLIEDHQTNALRALHELGFRFINTKRIIAGRRKSNIVRRTVPGSK